MIKIFLSILTFILPLILLEFTNKPGILPADAKIFLKNPKTKKLTVDIEDKTIKSGLIFKHQVIDLPLTDVKHIQQWVAGAGASVAVTDFDMDGLSDVYVSSMMINQPNRLFKNMGDGTFKDVTFVQFSSPSNDIYISMKSTFFDCDNDGYQDLLQITSDCPRLYRNKKGKGFEDITSKAGLNTCNAMYGNVADINNDGNLDVLYASYHMYGADKQMDNFSQGDSKHQFFAAFTNDGSCRFEPALNTGIKGVGLTQAIGVVDTRGIDRKDLWIVTDTGTDKIFLDNGNGTYTENHDAIKEAFNRHGMAFDVTYEKKNKKPYIYVSHIFRPGYIIEGNAFWDVTDSTSYKNIAPDIGIGQCGHAWGGKFIDIDNDSQEDLIVSNGFLSQDPTKNYSFPMALLSSTHRNYLKHAENWPAIKNASIYGYEKNCLFLRDGDKFVQPSTSTPLTDSTLDGRGVATIDILNDGNSSILIANQRQDLKLFTTTQKNHNNWIGFKFIGSCSNKDAFGTKVILHYNQDFRTKWYYPTNGFSAQSESSLKFGLGNHKSVDNVELIWPRGHKERFKDIKINTYNTLIEGKDCVSQN